MERIGHILSFDALRGLMIIFIVLIHTEHPDTPLFSICVPALFLISGTFYKDYPWAVFWRKKTQRLLIPFVFFYLTYYAFLLLLNFTKYHSIPISILYSFTDVFHAYAYNDGYIVNYPLWFIIALLVQHFFLYALHRITQRPLVILSVAFILSAFGHFYLWTIPTYLMLGRALKYFIFFAVGSVFGLKTNSLNSKQKNQLALLGAVILITCLFLQRAHFGPRFVHFLSDVLFSISSVYLIWWLFDKTPSNTILHPLLFFGQNSLIVLGLHDMILTIIRIGTENLTGGMSMTLGLLNWLLCLLILWPIILFLNKSAPKLVGVSRGVQYQG